MTTSGAFAAGAKQQGAAALATSSGMPARLATENDRRSAFPAPLAGLIVRERTDKGSRLMPLIRGRGRALRTPAGEPRQSSMLGVSGPAIAGATWSSEDTGLSYTSDGILPNRARSGADKGDDPSARLRRG